MPNDQNSWKELSKRLTFQTKEVWKHRDHQKIHNFGGDYKEFLGKGVTERLCVEYLVAEAKANGYVPFEEWQKNPPSSLQDQKFWINNRGKGAAFFRLGSSIDEGINFIASHIDSPRLDIKPGALYEDTQIALAKTHYYGGIKKYQWFNLPLALVGVVVQNTGKTIHVRIGMDPEDPVLMISDLLPHLDRREGDVAKVFQAESLNILMGTISITDEEGVKDPVLLNILNLLFEKYGLVQEDFVSAELQAVPAYPPRDLGLDRSMIGGYGHDDRACAYTSFRALLDAQPAQRVSCALFLDKEEIGSAGNTGAQHHFWKPALRHLTSLYSSDQDADEILHRSTLLSADGCDPLNPSFKDIHDPRNAPKMGHGICIVKYTGARGKSGSNDAHAEVMGAIRKLFHQQKIHWQHGLLGKVDLGGGGTVAQFYANQGISVVDVGLPVMAMHAPYEIISKADLYETYLGYKAFFEHYQDNPA